MFIAVYGTKPARAEPPIAHQHSPYHPEYEKWLQPFPSVTSCCNARYNEKGEEVGDCEATDFELRSADKSVQWWARIPPQYGGHFIPVPDEKIRPYKNPDQSGVKGHLCWTPNAGVMCAVPPTGSM